MRAVTNCVMRDSGIPNMQLAKQSYGGNASKDQVVLSESVFDLLQPKTEAIFHNHITISSIFGHL